MTLTSWRIERSTMKTVVVNSADDRERFCALPGLSPLTPDSMDATGADRHLLLLVGDTPVARCSLWWSAAPAFDERLQESLAAKAGFGPQSQPLTSTIEASGGRPLPGLQ